MKTAAEYAELAEGDLSDATGLTDSEVVAAYQHEAQVYATLAQAAATLEAARLMGPTPEDQARLDALAPKPGYFCRTEWDVIDGDATGHDGKPHRCVHPAGHEHEEPHYCRCGAEL